MISLNWKCFNLYIDLTPPETSLRKDMLNYAEYMAWEKSARRKLGLLAGLKIERRPNERTSRRWTAYRHWPHLLCWSWLLSIEFRKTWQFGLTYDRAATLLIAALFGVRIEYRRQDFDYMPWIEHDLCKDAPRIIWRSEVEFGERLGDA